jgi:hypothetical protein
MSNRSSGAAPARGAGVMNFGKWRKHCPMVGARKANRKTRVVLRVAVGRIKADEITLFLAANCKVGAKKFDRAIFGKNRDERPIGEALFTVGFGFGIHRFGAQLEADAGAAANMSHAHSSAGVVQSCDVIVSQSGSGACVLVGRRKQVASRKGKVGLGCLRNDGFRADSGFDERTRRMID